ncbi:MAG: hypothetical protein HY925_12125, partial [Elusimicrobia bacterium]|nr:hypothetical protein [Elusimicrobiota bacterium]
MAIRKPSAIRPLAIVLAMTALALLLRRPGEREEDRLLTAVDAAASFGGAFELPQDAGALPSAQRKELRDSVGPPAPAEAMKLRPMQADWNAIWGAGFSPLTVARMEASGRVQVAHGDSWTPPRLEPEPASALRAAKARKAAADAAAAAAHQPPSLRGRASKNRGAAPAPSAAPAEIDEDALDAGDEEDAGSATPESFVRPDGRLGSRILSWFRAAEAKRKERVRQAVARLRKTLKALLGRGILRPPQGNPKPPSFA